MSDELSPKHKEFVRQYLLNGRNATDAYRKVYPNNKNPDVDGHKLLVNPRVQSEIQRREKKIEEKFEITQDMILNELAKYAFRSNGDFEDVGPRDALTAITLLGNRLGMWKDGNRPGVDLGDKQAILNRLRDRVRKNKS